MTPVGTAGRGGVWTAAALMVTVLWGCAASTAYYEGTELARSGRTVEAMARFEEALRIDPWSPDYRIAYAQARDRLLAETIASADQAREKGDLEAADAIYRRVVAMGGAYDRAIAGLRAIDNQRRWMRMLGEARAAAERKDWDVVRATVRLLLQEKPEDLAALELKHQADAAVAAQARSDKGLAAAYRKPISIEFRDATLRTVFEVISRASGLNFVFDKDIRTDQRTSIYLRNSTIEAAVSMVLASNQLDQRVLDANSILIYPNTAAKQREHQALVVRSFYLANADAKSVANALKTLLKIREPVIDEKLNLVIVRDSAEAVRLAERIVALQDVADAEVMMEVEVLEVKRTRLLDLGVRWPQVVALSPLPTSSGGTLTLADLKSLSSSTIGVMIGPTTLFAQKTDGDVGLLANPRIRARNREKARIHIGDRVPNITTTATSTGFVSESVTYIDVGLKLDVEPNIYLGNEVAIKVALEVSNIISQVRTTSGTLAYQIGTRSASTLLRLKDGENQVLAGLIGNEDRRLADKVPGLGELPIVGRLFGRQTDDETRTEIVLSITPRVLRNVQRPDSSMIEFDSGTESNASGRGGDASPAPPPPAASPPAAPSPRAPGQAAGPAPPGSAGFAPGGASLPQSSQQTNPLMASPGTVAASGPQQGSLSTRWLGPATARVGEEISVRLLAQGDMPVTAVPLVIGFDPKALELASVTEGDFLRQGGGATNFTSQVNAAAGQVSIRATRTGGSGGAALEGAVAVLNFRVIGGVGSETRLLVQSIAPLDMSGRPMVGQPRGELVLSILP